MRDQHKIRSKFLGMSWSTANYRLQRMVMFQLVRKTGEDKCFRCKKKILKLKDFTIEHKKQWLDVDAELFWELENITFSHKSCNSGHTRRNLKIPVGKNWCYSCKEMMPTKQFYRNRTTRTGFSDQCKTCKNERQNERRRKNRMRL